MNIALNIIVSFILLAPWIGIALAIFHSVLTSEPGGVATSTDDWDGKSYYGKTGGVL